MTNTSRAIKSIPLRKSFECLHTDPENPRLSESDQGKNEKEILKSLFLHFDLEELAYSLAENGYFDEEPLVIVPKKLPKEFEKIESSKLKNDNKYIQFIKNPQTHFIVVEGNRRLSAVQLLLSEASQKELGIKAWPKPSSEIKKSLEKLPTIIYPRRDDVTSYLGVRHIVGIKKWESFAKARYIASLVGKGLSIEEIQERVGDRLDSTRRIYICYQLLQQVENEFDLDTKDAKNSFSFLMLSIGQGPIKDYLGLPKRLKDVNLSEPVDKKHLESLKNLFSWIYGEGKDIKRVINESRDITGKLSPVLSNELSLDYLITTRDLVASYELTGGEENLLIKYLKLANRNLQLSLGLLHKYKNNDDIKEQIKHLEENLTAIMRTLKK